MFKGVGIPRPLTRIGLMTSIDIQIKPECQISDFYTKGCGIQRAKRQEKQQFLEVFWGVANRQFTIYPPPQKKSPLTALTHIQMEPTYQILDFHTEGCGLQRVDRKEKNSFGLLGGVSA